MRPCAKARTAVSERPWSRLPVPVRSSYRSALRSITLLLLDVDGVLTDGRIAYSDDGREFKSFHVRDGHGIIQLRASGVRVGIITGRKSSIVTRRAEELGIADVVQAATDKHAAYETIKRRDGLEDRQIAYMGDDLPDLEVLRAVGFSAAPADAHAQVRRAVTYVCRNKGGEGAVREVVDLLLEAQKKGGRRRARP